MAIHHWAPLGSNGKVVQFLWHSRWPNCHIALHWCRFSGTTRSTAAACRSSPSPTSRPVSDSSSVPRSSFSLLSGAPPFCLVFALFLLCFCSHLNSEPLSPVSHCDCDCCEQEKTGSRGNGLCEVCSLPPPPFSCSSCFFPCWPGGRGLSLRGPSYLVWVIYLSDTRVMWPNKQMCLET